MKKYRIVSLDDHVFIVEVKKTNRMVIALALLPLTAITYLVISLQAWEYLDFTNIWWIEDKRFNTMEEAVDHALHLKQLDQSNKIKVTKKTYI